ncbi:DUF2259 domain-containing protein [Pseudahrensia aquimaris]|uniref:DUF2259 domain-containing protein n=1 Tax=Pseudahrensia aquimaris TaxID=744461 RepID=A0ABW3FJD6_9HYPH
MMKTLLFIAFVCFSTLAHAAQTSHLHFATFANNGETFLFIEAGTQDGSGTHYANAFAITVATDSYLDGFPIRLREDEEQALAREGGTPEESSERSHRDLNTLIDSLRANPNVAAILSNSSPTTERFSQAAWDAAPAAKQARFTKTDIFPISRDIWQLELANINFPADPEQCFGLLEQMTGFKLDLVNEETSARTTLNEDARVPTRRGCPQDYWIAHVFTHSFFRSTQRMAVILRFSKTGFEGPDRALMAVTTVMPE